MILSEYVLSPCIFDTSCYNSPEACSIHLNKIKEILIHEEALIRNLYNGKWSKYAKSLPHCHPNTQYILKAFEKHLRTVKAIRANLPVCNRDWIDEAIASYKEEAFDGIIASKEIVKETLYGQNSLIASIENLDKARWWNERSHSISLKRQTQDYIKHLKLLLNHAKSLIFIDPYFNPNNRDYEEFIKILDAINQTDVPPLIEIHLCHLEEGLTKLDYEQLFKQKLEKFIQRKNLIVNVFIRDKFHDRFILTNLLGIQSGHSFSISDDPNETTTWTRISRARRGELQNEFSENSRRPKKQHKFTVS